jgi:hypothetical protein
MPRASVMQASPPSQPRLKCGLRREEAPARLGEPEPRGLLLPSGLGTAQQLSASLEEADRSQAMRGP